MNKTRVDKYQEYRSEIEKMSFENEDSPIKKEEEDERIKQNALSHTVQDIMGKYDEYTVMIDNAEVAEKRLIEERRKKQEKKHKIKLIIMYSFLGLITIALITCMIILFIGL